LEAISKQCGFGSKNSFNRAFKKFTGKTPKEYQQRIEKKEIPNVTNKDSNIFEKV